MPQGLSQRWIEKTEYKYGSESKKQHIVQDTKVPELHIRFYPSGRKTWILRYYLPKERRRRQMTLGKFPQLDLKRARKEAIAELGRVVSGEDPLAVRSRSAEAETVADVVRLFIDDYAKGSRRSWERDERRLKRAILGERTDDKTAPADWSRRKAHSISHGDVRDLHRAMADTPYEANRVLSLLHVVFKWARKERHLPRDADNPAADVDPYPEESRDRVVERDEMKPLWLAIEEEDNPFVAALFKLLILTGQRKRELMRARWEHVDFEARHLLLPHTKSSRPHLVPLGDPALAILRSLPRLKSNPHVFCGRTDGEPLKSINRRWHRKTYVDPKTGKRYRTKTSGADVELHGVRNRAGLEGLRIHDLRHTAGWWIANELGYSELVVRGFLGHAIPGITGTYVDATTRRVPKEVRNAANEYAADIMATVGELGENVRSIHEGAK